MKRLCQALWLNLIIFMAAPTAHAALTIEITEGVQGALPIAVVPFGWEGPGMIPPVDIAEIVAGDLRRTGRFAPMPVEDLLARPTEGSQVNFTNWRILGLENLVVGKVIQIAPRNYKIRFQLFDVYKGAQLLGFSLNTTEENLRFNAHHIANLIYEKLTGQPGAFTTQIAYVIAGEEGGKPVYNLQIADADGYDPQTILTSKEPIMSASWSPDGKRLTYVSFEKGRSEIYVQEIATGKREVVSAERGINGAPVFSPDGRRLALTLSRHGSPDIFVLDLDSRKLQRLTTHYAIDTEPSWSPDGRHLVFTSDRGGKPQIYRVAADGSGRPERLTFEGAYNARPTYSPDGGQIAMVHGDGNRFRIAVLEVETGHLRILTKGQLDESPSFAPNGSMIIYATAAQGRGVLAAVSIDGQVHQRLALQEGGVREPSWSPFPSNR